MVLIVLYVSLLETLQDEEIVIQASQMLLLPECSVGAASDNDVDVAGSH